ncbi:MAG: hypothetical protein KBT03_02215 [Bacteroidales bacterium]|nr:hypothetical protein [Candidatus Scybalousia scybalohippi]
MKIDKVDLSSLGDVLRQELDDFNKSVHVAMVETCDEGIKEARKEIIRDLDTLQKGKIEDRKHYRSSFTTRKKNDLSRILWNKQYQLSHLLEDGHYVYNQYGGSYNIHPDYPLIFGHKKNGEPIIYGSRYGTSGKVTIGFKAWEKTEKHTADFVEKTLLKKLK